MVPLPLPPNRLDRVLEVLAIAYEYDEHGRMLGVRGGGVSPRFVFCRAPEGCVWRFRAGLPQNTVSKIAKLAGREPGLALQAGRAPAPPERLAMIAGLLGESPDAGRFEREALLADGQLEAEIWTLR
jgi:hypothetical protein